MLNGLKITTDAVIEAVGIQDGVDVVGINAALGSDWYDLIPVTDTLDLFVDRDQGEEVNAALTAIMQANGYAGAIHGTGMFFGADPETGTTGSLTDAQLAALVTSYTAVTHYWSPALTAH